jgi:hypothetical protein
MKMFGFCKKPVKPVEPIDADEQDLHPLQEIAIGSKKGCTYENFLVLLEAAINEWHIPYLWHLNRHNYHFPCCDFEREIYRNRKNIFESDIKYEFYKACCRFTDEITKEIFKNCFDRHQEFYKKKEIEHLFSVSPGDAVNLLELKKVYGHDVFWGKIFGEDYKPFKDEEWLESWEVLYEPDGFCEKAYLDALKAQS